jgi:hypothetical protein
MLKAVCEFCEKKFLRFPSADGWHRFCYFRILGLLIIYRQVAGIKDFTAFRRGLFAADLTPADHDRRIARQHTPVKV